MPGPVLRANPRLLILDLQTIALALWPKQILKLIEIKGQQLKKYTRGVSSSNMIQYHWFLKSVKAIIDLRFKAGTPQCNEKQQQICAKLRDMYQIPI